MTEFVTLNVSEDDGIPKLVAYPIALSESSKFKISALSKGKGKKRKFLLQSDHHGMPFEGHDHSSQNFCKFAVGYFDEKANEIELLPSSHVFIMEKVRTDKDAADIDEGIMSPLSHQQRKASLTEAFGSKKKKRAMRAMESNTISADSISGASSISQMIVTSNELQNSPNMVEKDSFIGDSAAKNALQAQREIMLPPHDANATSINGAFPLNDLIPRNVHHGIKEWIASITAGFSDFSPEDNDSVDASLPNLSAEWQEKLRQDHSPEFLVNLFSDAFYQHRSNIKDLKKKLGVLLMFDVQLKFCKAVLEARRQIDKEDLQKMLAYPPSEVFRHLTNNFAVFRKSAGKASFSTTKTHVDKVLMHTIVLSLHATDGIIPISAMCQFLQITAPRLNALVRECGCAVSKSGGSTGEATYGHVSLPLKFPEGKRGRK